MSLKNVLETARGELGVCEEPVNRVKYNTAYYGREVSGKDYAWCVVFLWWVFREAGERMSFFGGGKTGRCSTLLQWYQEQGLTVPVDEVQVGDIVLLNFHGGKDPEHCGLVTGKGVENFYWFVKTIEGNTSSGGSQDNGGMVCEKERYAHQIVAVCRPQYKKEEPDMKDDITGHWAEQSIRRVIGHGFLKGYPDGTFRPEQPVTRAELAVILDRLELEGRLGNA